MVEQNTLPASSVPAAFADGHLYSPTADLVAAGVDFRPGDQFAPMAPAPSGGVREKAAWWRTVASVSTPDFLGLVPGDAITVHHGDGLRTGELISTFRAGARVRVELPNDPEGLRVELTVNRRSPSGSWYGPCCDTPEG
ncbi:hypothetical protein LN042_22910 [Kitasatospora sp. RB6PN24]|uniref:hypothetical protein n=1 Tax=Kitasatospora humi TaxID=2893891 RepID=UPI001E5770E9|nr:hypothetical protein [Kitasatospora humi]MCC9309886.1 hypothetical protein [Kitasatospora humi]